MIDNKPQNSMIHHPLFIDALFVPTEQLHVKLVHRSPSKHQIQDAIVIPCANEQVSLNQIENILQTNIPQARISSIILNQSPMKKSKLKGVKIQVETLRQLKRKTGRKKSTNLQLQFQTDAVTLSKLNQPSLNNQSENKQKYEICFINLSTKSDVFEVVMQWSETVDVEKHLVSRINQWYHSTLSTFDLQFYRLKIDITPNKTFMSFRLKKELLLNKQKLNQLIFSDQSQAVYIGFDIINNAFKYRKPVKSLMTQQNTINIEAITSKIRNNPINQIAAKSIQPIQRILLVEFQDETGIRLEYNELRQYKIKYLLGILRVPDYDKKGLIVFNKLYLPDQHVYDFQYQYCNGNDLNFVMAKITSQKKLFLQIFQKEYPINNPKQIHKIFKNGSLNEKSETVCLDNYLNQAIYGDNNKEKYVCQVICDYIQKYFVEIQCLETTVWKKYIKTMLQQLNYFSVFQGEVYRAVDYQCSAEQGDQIQFKNFIVASRKQQCAKFKLKLNKNFNKTFFRIKSKTGRAVSSEFQLAEVIFGPYTYFKVNKKTKKAGIFEIQMQEISYEDEIYRSNLLIWIDDKQKQGKNIFQRLKEIQMRYPIILLQLNSTAEFKQTFQKYLNLFNNTNLRKILITNMTRQQPNKLNQIAGIDAHNLAKSKLKEPKAQTIFYIGNVQASKQKLLKNGIQPTEFILVNQTTSLVKRLIQFCNWQDLKKNQSLQNETLSRLKYREKPSSQIQPASEFIEDLSIESKIKGVAPKIQPVLQKQPNSPAKQTGWGDIFSKLLP